MAEVICRGLPASWLNAWLAAVGTTVLDSRIKLRWTTDSTPRAVLCAEGVDPVEALAASWPDRDEPGGPADCGALEGHAAVAEESVGRCVRGQSVRHPRPPVLLDALVDHDGSLRGRESGGGARPVRSGRARNDQVAASPPAEGSPASRAIRRTAVGHVLRHSRTRQGQRAGVRPDQDGIAVGCLRHDRRSGRRSAGVLRPCAVARARRRDRPERP